MLSIAIAVADCLVAADEYVRRCCRSKCEVFALSMVDFLEGNCLDLLARGDIAWART